jgi:UPF0271 protein
MDLNADLGESYGVYRYGNDEAMMPLITSANIACSFHAGDSRTMRDSVQLAIKHNVNIGAHIGLPDPLGFGRREMRITGEEAYLYTLHQLGALNAFLRPENQTMKHVKPHGALYMMASKDFGIAEGIIDAVIDFDPSLALYALPNSTLASAGAARGLSVVNEYFADRPYEENNVKMFGWAYEEIGTPDDSAGRVETMLNDPRCNTIGSICVHSDTQKAPNIMAAVRHRLLTQGVVVN